MYKLPMYSTCPAHLALLKVMFLIIMVKSTNYGAPHFQFFSFLCPTTSPQHPVLMYSCSPLKMNDQISYPDNISLLEF
jgi:hypothetical protein